MCRERVGRNVDDGGAKYTDDNDVPDEDLCPLNPSQGA